MDVDLPALDSYDALSDLDLMEELRRLELEETLQKEAALDELLEAIVADYVDRQEDGRWGRERGDCTIEDFGHGEKYQMWTGGTNSAEDV